MSDTKISWGPLLRLELSSIFHDIALVITVFGGVVFYSFLYPLPYAQQLPREQAVVVVDLDRSSLSRKLIRMVDATPEVQIKRYAPSLSQAQQAIVEGDVSGMLVIPDNFFRDLLLGKSPTVSYAGDASYFLVYGTVVKGLATAGGTLAAGASVVRRAIEGAPLEVAKQRHANIDLNLRPVFNPTTGYVHYVVPAVFILILHQTLLIATGLLGGGQNERNARGQTGYWRKVPGWKLALARSLCFVGIYLVIMAYYFGFSFEFYDIERLARPIELLQLALPFLLATSFMGICLGYFLRRRELATLIVLLSSLPLVFSAGFIWPVSMLPGPLADLSQLFPAIPGIQAFLQLNQMGADFAQIKPLWQQLWLQTLGYGALAMALLSHRKNRGQTPIISE